MYTVSIMVIYAFRTVVIGAIFAKCFAFSRVDNFYVSLVNILITNSIKLSVRYLNWLMYTISFIFLNISIPGLWPTPARTCCIAMVLGSPLANLGEFFILLLWRYPDWNTTFIKFMRKYIYMENKVFETLHVWKCLFPLLLAYWV